MRRSSRCVWSQGGKVTIAPDIAPDILDIREIHKQTAIIAVVGPATGVDDWHTRI
jgi:hypothetical protein